MRKPPRLTWIVIMASIVHITQAICMLLSPHPILITSVAMLYSLGDWASYTLLASGVLALYGILSPFEHHPDILRLITTIPQQIIIMAAALMAVRAMLAGQYADGTIRSIYHITGDQCIYPVLAFFHLAAVINHFLFYDRAL